MADPVIPVILSGGSGTRLWPMSRPQEPKQLIAMLDERTMLQATIDRLGGIADMAPPIVVCAESHHALVDTQTPPNTRLVLEPVGRNTAPAVAAAALTAVAGGGGLLLVLPADHVIRDTETLRVAVERAIPEAAAGRLVTFGIVPHYPETGYGYIRAGADTTTGVRVVEAFVEKPPIEVAREYVESGNHLWNSGMFLFRADRYLEELGRFAPKLLAATRRALEAGTGTPDARVLDPDTFAACPSDSIDFAVMEHTDDAVVVPLDAGWDDVGSWSALWSITTHDQAGNAVSGDVVALDVHNSYLRSEGRLLAVIGVEDLIVVETPDAVLVVPRAEAQRVKDVVAHLKDEARPEANEHLGHVSRWGRSVTLDRHGTHQVRRVEIAPGEEIPLESSPDHAETWMVVSGTATTSHRGRVSVGGHFDRPADGDCVIANRGDETVVTIAVTVHPPATHASEEPST